MSSPTILFKNEQDTVELKFSPELEDTDESHAYLRNTIMTGTYQICVEGADVYISIEGGFDRIVEDGERVVSELIAGSNSMIISEPNTQIPSWTEAHRRYRDHEW